MTWWIKLNNVYTARKFSRTADRKLAWLYFESCTPGKPLVGSTFTLALVTGQVNWDRMKSGFQRRSSKGTDLLPVGSPGGARIQRRPYVGSVMFETTSYNQEGRRRARPSAPS